MTRPTIVLELATYTSFERDLAAGGLFVPGCALEMGTDCDLRVVGASGELAVPARVVFVDPPRGAGLELDKPDAATKEKLIQLAQGEPAATAAAVDEREEEDEDVEREPIARNIFERLRGLTLAEQIKSANSNDPAERMALERMYGKNVWEALLRNPRLTAPEVTRLARLGTLPRVMLETIVNNGAWMQVPEVRRALLGNPRLGTDQILRVLRLLPKHELKVAATINTYPLAVRDQAKKLVKG
ncbi:MAG: PilZ domain-containing protein [Kofleriaceae bacterium]|nr:PilZ domain-containing protein [Kofleriaceae bacterium]